MLVLNEYVYDVGDDADLDDDDDGDDGGGGDDDDSAVDMLNDHEARVGTYRFKYNLFDSKEHTESCKKYGMTIGSSVSHHLIHHYIHVHTFSKLFMNSATLISLLIDITFSSTVPKKYKRAINGNPLRAAVSIITVS